MQGRAALGLGFAGNEVIQTSASGIFTVVKGKARGDVGVGVLLTRAVHNVEVVLLKQKGPARVLAVEVFAAHEVDEGLMVGDDSELHTLEVGAKCLDGPHSR